MMKSVYFLISAFLVCTSARADWHFVSNEVMTTRLELEFWLPDQANAKAIEQSVLKKFDEIEAGMSRYKPESELSRLNDDASDRAVVVSGELFRILDKSLRVSELSKGAFDISFASIGYLYNYRKSIQPSQTQIDEHLPSVDYRHIILDHKLRTVRFSSQGVKLDLGGIAKGYAVDEGIRLLRAHGVKHARLSAGGDMFLLGDKRGKPWIVAVRDPRDENKNVAVLPLSDVALSTSGDYQRFFISDQGERVHHIISPKTGKSANGLKSVSILGPDTTTTDSLSTAVFVLGLDKGMELVNRLNGVDAIIIDDKHKVHYSSGLQRR